MLRFPRVYITTKFFEIIDIFENFGKSKKFMDTICSSSQGNNPSNLYLALGWFPIMIALVSGLLCHSNFKVNDLLSIGRIEHYSHPTPSYRIAHIIQSPSNSMAANSKGGNISRLSLYIVCNKCSTYIIFQDQQYMKFITTIQQYNIYEQYHR